MTVSSTTNRVSYTGNGVTTAFAFGYLFLANSDLKVVLVTTADGTETLQVLDTDYTLTGAGSPSGGTVTFLSAPASTKTIVIYRDPALTQPLDLVANDPLPANSLEEAVDRVVLQVQRVNDRVSRTIHQPDGDTTAMAALPAMADRLGKYMYFDATNGDPTVADAVGEFKGVWATATAYIVGDVVRDESAGADTRNQYRCLVAHTSGTWATDLAASKWVLFLERGATGATGAVGGIPVAQGAGTVDAITADFSPNLSLTDGLVVGVISAGTNTSTTPTLATDASPPRTIVKHGGRALVAGDVPAARATALYQYDLTNTRWELLNPVAVSVLGRQTVYIPATAMVPNTTNGPSLGTVEQSSNKNMTKTHDYDTTTSESAQFLFEFPTSWNRGTVSFAPHWTAASGSGTVVFALSGVAISNDDALDVAFGTAQSSTDTFITAYDEHRGPESAAVTIAGTPAANDLINFKIARDVANDTLGVDAKLIGITLIYTVDKGVDN